MKFKLQLAYFVLAVIIFGLSVRVYLDAVHPDAGAPADGVDFCGWSTKGSCDSGADCLMAGCSSQICRARSEESLFSTCEWRDCYNAKAYGLSCGCVDGQCQWGLYDGRE